MRNNGISYILIASLGLLAVYSCVDEIADTAGMQDAISDNHKNITTKSVATDYYWHKGKKVYLQPDPGKEYIIYSSNDAVAVTGLYNITEKNLQGDVEEIALASDGRKGGENLRWAIVETSPLATSSNKTTNKVIYKGKFYKNDIDQSIGLSHLIYVKLKAEEDLTKLQLAAEKYGAEILGNNTYMPLWYTLNCTNVTQITAIQLANELFESGDYASAQPALITDDELTFAAPNDTYFNLQWNLSNTGQHGTAGIGCDIDFLDANEITKGNNDVVVAVIDQGVDRSHSDLNIYSLSYDTHNKTSPSVLRGSHGTACAGIIGAHSNNNKGVSGIAPLCPIMSISNSLLPYANICQDLADGFNYAWRNGADVISNSWGGVPTSEILEDAIFNALNYGRNGKGCVVVFASGNNNASTVSYPANSFDDILAVGAMCPCGQRKSPTTCDGEDWWGSNYGAALDIIAPGVFIPTTDIAGSVGYETGDYFMTFNGTSSACPHVAAVAALILSEKPSLTQQQVVSAILRGARKLSGYSYSTTKTYGTWNNQVGYGALDAETALQIVGEANSLSNQSIVNNTIVYGTEVELTNIQVVSGAEFKVSFKDMCIINKNFTAERGSIIELRK